MTDDLQARVGEWHRARFPDAQMFHVALKGAEEMGEVAQAVNGVLSTRSSATARDGTVPGEAADVVIAMLALVDRWCDGVDLLEAVERKLRVLTDPNSGHRSTLIARAEP